MDQRLHAFIAGIDPPSTDWRLSRAVRYIQESLASLEMEDLRGLCSHYGVGVDDLVLGVTALKLGWDFDPSWTSRGLTMEEQLVAEGVIE